MRPSQSPPPPTPLSRSSTPPPRSVQALVGRQPVFDTKLDVYAYELLFRGQANDTRAVFDDAFRASSTVIVHAFADIGLERVAGAYPVLVNIAPEFLTGGYELPLPPVRTILEILETVEPTDTVVRTVASYAKHGFRIALDDFVYRPEMEPLLDLASLVKIDFLAHDRESLFREVERLAKRSSLRLVAEKLETKADVDLAKELGFSYFQGYFFCRPDIVSGRRPAGATLNLLRFMKEVAVADTSTLRRIVSHDVNLSYRLLRCVNSAAFGLSRPVESIHQATVLIGEKKLRQWLWFLAMTSVNGKPHELMITAMLRAGMCEVLGLRLGKESPAFFTAGLFSVLEALLDIPMETVLRELPLSDEVAAALRSEEGLVGEVLRCVLMYERGDFEQAQKLGYPLEELADAWRTSTGWVEDMRKALIG